MYKHRKREQRVHIARYASVVRPVLEPRKTKAATCYPNGLLMRLSLLSLPISIYCCLPDPQLRKRLRVTSDRWMECRVSMSVDKQICTKGSLWPAHVITLSLGSLCLSTMRRLYFGALLVSCANHACRISRGSWACHIPGNFDLYENAVGWFAIYLTPLSGGLAVACFEAGRTDKGRVGEAGPSKGNSAG